MISTQKTLSFLLASSVILSMTFTPHQLFAGILSFGNSIKCDSLLEESSPSTSKSNIFQRLNNSYKNFLAKRKAAISNAKALSADKEKAALEQQLQEAELEIQKIKEQKFQAIKKATTLSELAKLKFKGIEREFIDALDAEAFDLSHPFYTLKDMAPIAEIILRGIDGIERKTYRSTTNESFGAKGHDVVTYEIYHPDGKISIVQAMKHGNGNPYATMGGGLDLRRVQLLFYNSNSNGNTNYRWYSSGNLEQETLDADYETGIQTARNFIKESLARRGIRQMPSP